MRQVSLYRYFDENMNLLYLGVSQFPLVRFKQHHAESHWTEAISTITIEWYETRELAMQAEKIAIRSEGTAWNQVHNPHPPAWSVTDGLKVRST